MAVGKRFAEVGFRSCAPMQVDRASVRVLELDLGHRMSAIDPKRTFRDRSDALPSQLARLPAGASYWNFEKGNHVRYLALAAGAVLLAPSGAAAELLFDSTQRVREAQAQPSQSVREAWGVLDELAGKNFIIQNVTRDEYGGLVASNTQLRAFVWNIPHREMIIIGLNNGQSTGGETVILNRDGRLTSRLDNGESRPLQLKSANSVFVDFGSWTRTRQLNADGSLSEYGVAGTEFFYRWAPASGSQYSALLQQTAAALSAARRHREEQRAAEDAVQAREDAAFDAEVEARNRAGAAASWNAIQNVVDQAGRDADRSRAALNATIAQAQRGQRPGAAGAGAPSGAPSSPTPTPNERANPTPPAAVAASPLYYVVCSQNQTTGERRSRYWVSNIGAVRNYEGGIAARANQFYQFARAAGYTGGGGGAPCYYSQNRPDVEANRQRKLTAGTDPVVTLSWTPSD